MTYVPNDREHADREVAKPVFWSRHQQVGLTILLFAAAVYAGIQLLRNSRYVSDPQPTIPSRAAELADRMDPNIADAGSLSALPQVGEKRARDLIAYRERMKSRQKDGIVFHRPLDLLRVPGFGPSLAEQMEPYLVFPTGPSTMPAGQ